MTASVSTRCLAIASLALSLSCSKLLSKQTPDPRPAEDGLVLSHAAHSEIIECTDCHGEVAEATNLDHSLVPKEEVCLECHEDEKAGGNCGFCHKNAAQPSYTYAVEPPHLRFDHAAHLPRAKGECARCHVALPEPDRYAALTPSMATCLGCHEHQAHYDALVCDGCHVNLTGMPLEPTSMYSHDGDFVDTHRLSARSAPEACMQCHDQTHCADCHAKTVAAPLSLQLAERLDRNFIHRNDFVGRHMVEARADPGTCQRCHGTSFCDSCHELQNLTPQGSDPRNPHPVGYAFPTAERFHGDDARRDIASCAACHDQGVKSVCVDCHQVGGVGGNPHPDSWLDRHDASEIRTNSMCRYCHL